MRLIDADAIRIKPEYMHDICGVAMIRVEDIARILNDMPTINPESERKKGKWDFIGNQLFKCTSCEKVYSQDQFYALQTYYSDPEFPNYCPNCGCQMNGGEQDDTD